MYKTHELKTWPEYFCEVVSGNKTFELRKNDRNFCPGDILILKEYDPETKQYTGRTEWKEIGFLVQGIFGLPDDVCVMSILPYK
jgi:hypothetical protein